MAIGIQNFENVDPPDSDYPNGKIKDDDGTGDGTEVDIKTYGDVHQWMAKILRVAGIIPNGLPENEYSGHQYYQALVAVILARFRDITTELVDVDNILLSGIYVAGSSAANRPIIDSDTGLVLCYNFSVDSSYLIQIYSKSSSDHIFYRRRQSNVWESWQEIAKIADVTSAVNTLSAAIAATNPQSLITTVIDIGAWNMNTGRTKVVNHGVGSAAKIISVKAYVLIDGGGSISFGSGINLKVINLEMADPGGGTDVYPEGALFGSVRGWDDNQVELWSNAYREFGTNSVFTSTSASRGKIVIVHLP